MILESIFSIPNVLTESRYFSGVTYMQKHARTSAERRRRNRFSFRSFLSASVIKIGGGFLSNVSFSSRRRSCCCCCRDIDGDTEEEEAEEEAIALDIGRDIFNREMRDDFPTNTRPKREKSSAFDFYAFCLFCAKIQKKFLLFFLRHTTCTRFPCPNK